jgi:hypothetical protein
MPSQSFAENNADVISSVFAWFILLSAVLAR